MAQAATQSAALDQAIAYAAGSGQLELNAFLPQIAANLLEMLDLLDGAVRAASKRCIADLRANVGRCRDLALRSAALATVLLPLVGYHKATEIARAMRDEDLDLFAAAAKVAGLSRDEVAARITPTAVNALGFMDERADAECENTTLRKREGRAE
jgi:aspartate ammonia-lyase